jgi:hypothetical protein
MLGYPEVALADALTRQLHPVARVARNALARLAGLSMHRLALLRSSRSKYPQTSSWQHLPEEGAFFARI